MKTLRRNTLFLFICFSLNVMAAIKEVPFTLDDRDRIIRTEQKLEAMDKKLDSYADGLRSEINARFETVNNQFASVDQRFDAMDKRFEQLFNFLWAIIGIFTAMMISVFGFAFWDRKLSLAPLKKEDQRIISVLVDFAKTQPKLTEILRNAGFL